MIIIAFHGSPFRLDHFKPSPFGIHAGNFDQSVHAATQKLSRIPFKLFESLHEDSDGWKGSIYRVRLTIHSTVRIADPRTPRKWRVAIERAKKDGYDSILYLNEYEGQTPSDSYCVFDPCQIEIVERLDGNEDCSSVMTCVI